MFVRLASMIFMTGLLAAESVEAQTPSRQAVVESMETCRTIEVDFMRRACLEAAEEFLRTGPEEAARAPAQRADVAEEVASVDVPEAEAADTETRRRFGLIPRAERSESGREALAVSVTSIATNRQGHGRFRLSDGSLLVQFSGGYTVREPSSLPASARIERRLFGSTWLIFDEAPNRGYKVRVTPRED